MRLFAFTPDIAPLDQQLLEVDAVATHEFASRRSYIEQELYIALEATGCGVGSQPSYLHSNNVQLIGNNTVPRELADKTIRNAACKPKFSKLAGKWDRRHCR